MKKLILLLALTAAFNANAGTDQDLLVPAYFYPSQWQANDWDVMAAKHSASQIVIANDANGMATQINSDYATEISQAQAAGLLVVGYISTNYGNRDIDDVKSDITNFHDWYEGDGIFLDEVSTDLAKLSYYQDLLDHINTVMGGGNDVILNHGTNPPEEYAQLDTGSSTSQLTLVTFEGVYADYITSAGAPSSWMANYPTSRFAHLVYGVSSANMQSVIELSNDRRAGYIYATDDAMPNPWDALATYNSDMVDAVAP